MRILSWGVVWSVLLVAVPVAHARPPKPPKAKQTKQRRAAADDATGERGRHGDRKHGGRHEDQPISLGLVLGYGFSLEDAPANPWGVGFGARGGYNLGDVFLGARFVFYVGEDPSNIWELGLDAGYEFTAGVFTARPEVGVGVANVTIELGPTTMESETELFVAPGLSLLVDVVHDVYVGVEGRVQLIFAEPGREAVIVLGNAGLRF